MKYNPAEIIELIKSAFKKAELTISTKNFAELEERINATPNGVILGKRALYKMYNKSNNCLKENETSIGFNETNVNTIAMFLGAEDFESFDPNLFSYQDEILEGSLGNWYSIVRANSGLPYLYIAAVRIFEEKGRYMMEMRGGRTFIGEVKRKKEFIYCSLENDHSKVLHLTFKIGYIARPTLLMGIFSGVSTGGDPIAGRELLWRSEEDYMIMEPAKIPLKHPDQWPDWIPASIFRYFKSEKENCLRGSRSISFSLDDLELLQ